jgi:hypothetical protein
LAQANAGTIKMEALVTNTTQTVGPVGTMREPDPSVDKADLHIGTIKKYTELKKTWAPVGTSKKADSVADTIKKPVPVESRETVKPADIVETAEPIADDRWNGLVGPARREWRKTSKTGKKGKSRRRALGEATDDEASSEGEQSDDDSDGFARAKGDGAVARPSARPETKAAYPINECWETDATAPAPAPWKKTRRGDKNKKGAGIAGKGEAKGRADGQGADETEQSDDDSGGEGITIAGPRARLRGKSEPPETKATEMVDESPELDDPAPAPESKKNIQQRGGKKNITKVWKRRESGARSEGEAKDGAADQVAGEGGRSHGDAMSADHGGLEVERLAGQMGPPSGLPATKDGPDSELEPDANGVSTLGESSKRYDLLCD